MGGTYQNLQIRGIAQSGSAPALGAGCREFESLYPDQTKDTGCKGKVARRKHCNWMHERERGENVRVRQNRLERF